MWQMRKFLFVEDDIQSIHFFRKALIKVGVQPENVIILENLDDAMGMIRQNRFDCIFIDLYCPPLSSELRKYSDLLGEAEFNHGQFLGLWIDEFFPGSKYVYITQVPTQIKSVNPIQDNRAVFNKNQLTSQNFIEQLQQLLS
jgi:hypothetical protein